MLSKKRMRNPFGDEMQALRLGHLYSSEFARAIVLFGLLALTLAIYIPGLYGGFLFDDFPNVVDNLAVHVEANSVKNWWLAAQASPSAELKRPLAMLSFAINEFFTGNDPFPMKSMNLGIHLCNGVLTYLMLTELLLAWGRVNDSVVDDDILRWLALLAAGTWMVMPINLSSVLYIVQRMESLAHVFVLLGLFIYFRARRSQIAGDKQLATSLIILPACSLAGALSKESAVLLPAYAFLAEGVVLRWRTANTIQRRSLQALFLAVLAIPTFIVLTKLLPSSLDAHAYSMRPFTLEERLLTEPRILLHYLVWSLLPTPQALGFYHDDLQLSTGLLSPSTTLLAIGFILALLLLAFVVLRRTPLFSLAILWFLIAHSMTATVIPLELVFEHRNYFSSMAAIFGIMILLLGQPRLAIAALIVCIFSYAAITAVRAYDWGHPLRFAYSEARHHPRSARALYELGRTLVVASSYKSDSPMIDPAKHAFESAMRLPDSSILGETGLILVAAHMQQPLESGIWSSILEKLRKRPPSEEDISGLNSLADCQRKGVCPAETTSLLSAYLASLSFFPPRVRLLGDYSDFVETQLHDYALSAQVLQQAIAADPFNHDFQISLVRVLQKQDKDEEAARLAHELTTQHLSEQQRRRLDSLRAIGKQVEVNSQ